ncbi:C39 family peptidase [Pseudanabaena sp. FACHB-1998]|uniref:C39 family peptidase n=1 Tax=Pseudanabaena sp. FACHB-1998 TaxID=2692858 RepID=UPI00167FE61B|nr:C39 family peptidase [Pseudanabaena sp. FACHB-1998]MBD2178438.1 C39 family peptidase [Pseudanabaena sp. FACHB-1998]
MRFFKNFTLALTFTITGLAIALTTSPTNSAIATLNRPHTKPISSPNLLPNSSEFIATGAKQVIELPDTGAQNDSWSCGPNSAARVLRYYGHEVDYVSVRALTDKKLFLPQKMRNPFNNQWIEIRTGTPPATLQQVMQRWEGDRVKRSPQTSFNRLINLVRSGKPAIALVRVGGFTVPYVGTIPYLHWIAVTGVDPQRQQIYYTDTNSQSYSMSYKDFQTQWNLGLDRDVSMAIANVLKSNGVEARTIVWVDRS